MTPEPAANKSLPNRIGVLLVEDHPVTREGLRAAIACQPDMCVAGESATWRGALALARDLAPDVLVLDLNLPDGNGWTLLEQLRGLGALPPTLVLSVCDEAVYARRILQAGARGYLMKDEPIGCILQAIRDIHAGVRVASRAVTSQLMTEALNLQGDPETLDVPSGTELLSDRELQVFSLIGANMSNKEVAAHLGLSQKTVSTYKVRLMDKLGVRTTPELIACFQIWKAPGAGGAWPPVENPLGP
jgi:DNA-binding NarL/FixJ family response regulator